MEPHLSKNDKLMFYRYLDKATIFFEFGSGGSTYQASIRENIKHIYSVESDEEWHNKLKTVISNANITYIFNNMETIPNNWGNPGKFATDTQKQNYSNHMRHLSEQEYKAIDLVFIDGRFRVACCLKCHGIMKENCLIAFDDFLNRTQYHEVLNYFDIVEQTQDKRMVILKKKANTVVLKEVIEKYELEHN